MTSRLIGDDGPGQASYELRIEPVPAGKTVAVDITWVAPLTYEDGRLMLRLPSRGNATNLVDTRGKLRITPPPGVTAITDVHVGGTLLAKRATAGKVMTFAVPDGDVVIDVTPRLDRPVVAAATAPLAGDLHAVALAVLVPRPTGIERFDHERLLLVVDVSRSLGEAGRAATARIVDGLLGATAAATKVEVVLHDRTARRVFARWQELDAARRTAIGAAITAAPLANGSALGPALEVGREVLREARRADEHAVGAVRTMVVVVSDGVLPLSLSADEVLSRLDVRPGDVDLGAVLAVPDDAVLPDTGDGALAEAARRLRGRVVAVRHAEVDLRAKGLATELRRPDPLDVPALDLGSAVPVGLELPRAIAAGEGVIVVGWAQGKVGAIKLTARRGGHDVTIKAAALRGAPVGALGLAGVADDSFGTAATDNDGRSSGGAFARRAAARRHGVVTHDLALVALDRRDRLAVDRLSLGARGGTFARVTASPDDDALPAFHEEPIGRSTTAMRTSGTLDKTTLQFLLTQQLLPRARVCYQDALRKDHGLAGRLVLAIEIARGEITDVTLDVSTFGNAPVVRCILDAVYELAPPRVALGRSESIDLVRYPITFERGDLQPGFPGDADSADPIDTGVVLDADAPMPKLP